MRKLANQPAQMVLLLIRVYQRTLGSLLPRRCRFHPSCSVYASEAIKSRGLIRGGAAAAWRLIRCGPWTAGGLDPVRSSRPAGGALDG